MTSGLIINGYEWTELAYLHTTETPTRSASFVELYRIASADGQVSYLVTYDDGINADSTVHDTYGPARAEWNGHVRQIAPLPLVDSF